MNAYHYTESGLDTVIIEGVNFLADDNGADCITIPNVNGLHRAIAEGIVHRKSAMTGRELRFLRTELGMTQAELAIMLHREALAVSRWERGENPVDENAEALIRLHAIATLGLSKTLDIPELSSWCVPSASTPPIRIDGSNTDDYRPIAA